LTWFARFGCFFRAFFSRFFLKSYAAETTSVVASSLVVVSQREKQKQQKQKEKSEMRVQTLQICWHKEKAVFSADFSPLTNRLATGGADNDVKVCPATALCVAREREHHRYMLQIRTTLIWRTGWCVSACLPVNVVSFPSDVPLVRLRSGLSLVDLAAFLGQAE
jgi:WD40 repeat protein